MPGHVFTQNTDFDGRLLENRNFSENVTNRKVVDNGLYYLRAEYLRNPWSRFRELEVIHGLTN